MTLTALLSNTQGIREVKKISARFLNGHMLGTSKMEGGNRFASMARPGQSQRVSDLSDKKINPCRCPDNQQEEVY